MGGLQDENRTYATGGLGTGRAGKNGEVHNPFGDHGVNGRQNARLALIPRMSSVLSVNMHQIQAT